MKMNYTEKDIRNAFKAGLTKGNHKSYFDAPLDEDEYIEELKQVKNNFILADVSGECLHPYNSVRTDKITELSKCAECGKEWY